MGGYKGGCSLGVHAKGCWSLSQAHPPPAAAHQHLPPPQPPRPLLGNGCDASFLTPVILKANTGLSFQAYHKTTQKSPAFTAYLHDQKQHRSFPWAWENQIGPWEGPGQPPVQKPEQRGGSTCRADQEGPVSASSGDPKPRALNPGTPWKSSTTAPGLPGQGEGLRQVLPWLAALRLCRVAALPAPSITRHGQLCRSLHVTDDI